MAVYVDDMYRYPIGEYRGMKMSHLTADTTEELLAMVDTIGVQRKWIQYPGTWKEHFDIAFSKRKLAVEAGAIEIEYGTECAIMDMRRRITGEYGPPSAARAWYAQHQKLKSIAKEANGQQRIYRRARRTPES